LCTHSIAVLRLFCFLHNLAILANDNRSVRLCDLQPVASMGYGHKSTRDPVVDVQASAPASWNVTERHFSSQAWRRPETTKERQLTGRLIGPNRYGMSVDSTSRLGKTP
jgi:hypothetical protein